MSEAVKTAFMNIDKNGDGWISKEEMIEVKNSEDEYSLWHQCCISYVTPSHLTMLFSRWCCWKPRREESPWPRRRSRGCSERGTPTKMARWTIWSLSRWFPLSSEIVESVPWSYFVHIYVIYCLTHSCINKDLMAIYFLEYHALFDNSILSI